MFILDSLFISGFRWVLDTVVTAAETEMNDDSALREQLLAAEMRREMGEISDQEFAALESDLLARIREIKERRDGGSGPIAFGGEPLETSPDSQFSIEATVSGDFHEPVPAPAVIEGKVVQRGASKSAGEARRPRSLRRSRSLRSSPTAGSSGSPASPRSASPSPTRNAPPARRSRKIRS